MQRLALLLGHDAGCMLDTPDKDGYLPIASAIYLHNYVILGALLDSGANATLTNNQGENILHQAAKYGTSQIVETLIQDRITSLDIRTPDALGRTPLTTLRIRFDEVHHADYGRRGHRLDDETMGKFEHLLTDIRDRAVKKEAEELGIVIHLLQQHKTSAAREKLHELSTTKRQLKVGWEADTFEAIDIQVTQDMIEPAIESIREFMDVSCARLQVSPFDEVEADPEYYHKVLLLRRDGEGALGQGGDNRLAEHGRDQEGGEEEGDGEEGEEEPENESDYQSIEDMKSDSGDDGA
ncbi:hypothetical protein B0I35DRAFT_198734 [Stachybotrys elegans]|uniref:Uncharacterized protein n=1 Tax=Stachybotrys elegans TaxID=80388 RepID=A0A8K0SXM6_9HYPO|nr:hypothetical protein B0I35DRAFT_198734 [Stachybotrys elegans]